MRYIRISIKENIPFSGKHAGATFAVHDFIRRGPSTMGALL